MMDFDNVTGYEMAHLNALPENLQEAVLSLAADKTDIIFRALEGAKVEAVVGGKKRTENAMEFIQRLRDSSKLGGGLTKEDVKTMVLKTLVDEIQPNVLGEYEVTPQQLLDEHERLLKIKKVPYEYIPLGGAEYAKRSDRLKSEEGFKKQIHHDLMIAENAARMLTGYVGGLDILEGAGYKEQVLEYISRQTAGRIIKSGLEFKDVIEQVKPGVGASQAADLTHAPHANHHGLA